MTRTFVVHERKMVYTTTRLIGVQACFTARHAGIDVWEVMVDGADAVACAVLRSEGAEEEAGGGEAPKGWGKIEAGGSWRGRC
jgi:hypothetical protein